MVAQLFFAWLVQSVFHQNAVELTVEIDLVTNKLEPSFNCIQEALLDDELFDVADLSTQVLNTLTEPDFGSVSTLTGLQWNKNFYFVVKLFRCRLKFGLYNSRVELQKTNIS